MPRVVAEHVEPHRERAQPEQQRAVEAAVLQRGLRVETRCRVEERIVAVAQRATPGAEDLTAEPGFFEDDGRVVQRELLDERVERAVHDRDAGFRGRDIGGELLDAGDALLRVIAHRHPACCGTTTLLGTPPGTPSCGAPTSSELVEPGARSSIRPCPTGLLCVVRRVWLAVRGSPSASTSILVRAGRAKWSQPRPRSADTLPAAMIRDDLSSALLRALETAGLPVPAGGVLVEPSRRREQGDWSTPIALALRKDVGGNPLDIARRIAQALEDAHVPHLAKVEVAPPGFVNLFLAPTWLDDVLRAVVDGGDEYGRSDVLAGRRINLEFVYANPTGPLHAGGGRWVAVGDAIANLFAAQGADVHREYYLNDAGSQLEKFRDSLYARYRGEAPPEDGYQGRYLVDLAEELRGDLGDDVSADAACEWGYRRVVRGLVGDLARIGVHFDTWFSERTLHERGDVERTLRDLETGGHVFDDGGARWLRSTAFGDARDRVLVRSDGTTTYLCNDIAYHRDKFERGFTHLVDIWGADHHGQVKSLQAGMQALGFAPGEPEILLGQLVRLVSGGREVRLSKRTGTVVTLADILDEVDPDVARMTFLLQGIDSAQTFDLDVVTQQSLENPVYYVQYAHARIASIGRKAVEAGVERAPIERVDLSRLRHEREDELLRALAAYPEAVQEAADARAPQKLSTWVRDFARGFHGFYRDCRVLSGDDELTQARLWLTEACRIGLANALSILGVHAPDEMARLDVDDDGPDGELGS